VAQASTEGSVRVRYTPTDMNLADYGCADQGGACGYIREACEVVS
jgi:hypothetical protein